MEELELSISDKSKLDNIIKELSKEPNRVKEVDTILLHFIFDDLSNDEISKVAEYINKTIL